MKEETQITLLKTTTINSFLSVIGGNITSIAGRRLGFFFFVHSFRQSVFIDQFLQFTAEFQFQLLFSLSYSGIHNFRYS